MRSVLSREIVMCNETTDPGQKIHMVEVRNAKCQMLSEFRIQLSIQHLELSIFRMVNLVPEDGFEPSTPRL